MFVERFWPKKRSWFRENHKNTHVPCLPYSQGEVAIKTETLTWRAFSARIQTGNQCTVVRSYVTLAKSHSYSAGRHVPAIISVKQSFRKEKQKRLSGGINTPGLITGWAPRPWRCPHRSGWFQLPRPASYISLRAPRSRISATSSSS